MNALESLAAHLARGNKVSAAASEKIRLHVVDAVAAWIAGSATPEGSALLRFRAEHRSRSGSGGLDNGALDLKTHCALARLSEIDDIHLASMVTPGGIVVPAALTLAALPQCDGAALAPAILAGYEAMIRLGLALDGPAILYRGIWPSYLAAPFGVAAVAARLLQLDERATAHALALAVTLASPGVGHHNAAATSRWFSLGHAAANGFSAALAAQAGFTSDQNIVDGGFLPGVYGITPGVAVLAENLGDRDLLAEVSFKPWCAARQTIAATQALREVLDHGVAAADITAIDVSVLPPHRKMIDHGVTVGDRASHLTSLPYQMAIAAVAPDDAFAVGQSPREISEPVRALMAVIRLEPDEGLLASYPGAWPARIRVKTHANEHERMVTHVPGDPARPFDADRVAQKFHRFVTPVVGAAAAQSLLRTTLGVLRDGGRPQLLLNEIEQVFAHAPAEAG
jgi:2-methylcitrate dehydratase PrpD